MEWTPTPDGIGMCQGGGNMNATTKEEASMKQVTMIGIDLAKRRFQLQIPQHRVEPLKGLPPVAVKEEVAPSETVTLPAVRYSAFVPLDRMLHPRRVMFTQPCGISLGCDKLGSLDFFLPFRPGPRRAGKRSEGRARWTGW